MDERERLTYAQPADDWHPQTAGAAFSEIANAGQASVVAALQMRFAAEVEKLAQIDRANSSHWPASAALRTMFGVDPAAAEATRVGNAATRLVAVEKLRAARSALDQHLASESRLTAVVGFLSAVKEKRALLLATACLDWRLPSGFPTLGTKFEAIF